MDYEYIVVGSGPSGAMAAQTLVEAGKQVALVDVGVTGVDYESFLPDEGFEKLRHRDENQHRYLLGGAFESVDWDGVKVGAQLTPARKHLVKDVSKLIPMISDTFFPMESMAYGGLGSGWGLGTYVYSDAELTRAGLNPQAMHESYQVVSDRIGIATGRDDLSTYITGGLENIQPPLKMDNSAAKLLAAYTQKKRELNRRGIYMGNPSMALLSNSLGNRQATKYQDMDFYSDRGEAAYRPWITVNALKERPNFTYLGNLLVLHFVEHENETTLHVKNVQTSEYKSITCRKLILAAGVLGSARIVLRSFKGQITRLPILCNPYVYMPALHLRMFGSPLSEEKTSMAQAFMIYDVNRDGNELVSMAIYTYRSLLLYKLIKEAPLNFADGLGVFRALQSALMIVGIHHPDSFSPNKYLSLVDKPDSFTGDALFAHYELSNAETQTIKEREKAVRAAFMKIGCYPLRRIQPGHGGSIHYAGSLPFSADEMPGSTHPSGRLHGRRSVFVADGSGFTYLPAKGITLTLMANAHRTAKAALDG
ncbi:MAG: hypothetical protein J0L96_05100 [Anaerolineae bacterium]|nr:hypothetical protein [Anaerolineae bacterium]